MTARIPDSMDGDLAHNDPDLVEEVGLALMDVALGEAGVKVEIDAAGTPQVTWPRDCTEHLGRLLIHALRVRMLRVEEIG
ncbi:hypothetical protein [Engelhardtia mirabilis]|uniref:Uncharacterized protein n=1 Tax=Engelhardtia mirabilis TaxID=2528011 RepID=A0A518BL78_9BACT|nr:hypothetical protein Pla133_28120 [Planctomycetes bacterium Pla133]QDV02050.1 hypothetical protein Pla86_28110 [Planctomycetes bacterium Pla86]